MRRLRLPPVAAVLLASLLGMAGVATADAVRNGTTLRWRPRFAWPESNGGTRIEAVLPWDTLAVWEEERQYGYLESEWAEFWSPHDGRPRPGRSGWLARERARGLLRRSDASGREIVGPDYAGVLQHQSSAMSVFAQSLWRRLITGTPEPRRAPLVDGRPSERSALRARQMWLKLSLSLAQEVPYEAVPDTLRPERWVVNGWLPPVSVLRRMRGDCDSKAALCGSLWLSEYSTAQTAPILVVFPTGDVMHALVGVPLLTTGFVDERTWNWRGLKYLLCETTSGSPPGSISGEIYDSLQRAYAAATVRVFPLAASP